MSHHMKDPEQQMAYWLTLQKQCFNPQLAEHQFNELRAALRDAQQELQEEKKRTTILSPASLLEFLSGSFYVLNPRGDNLLVIRPIASYCNGEEVVLMASQESSGMIYVHDNAHGISIMLEDTDRDIDTPRIADKLTKMVALHGSHYDPATHQISVRTQRSTAVDQVKRLTRAVQHIAETNALDL
jgi:hypothetical protein